MPLFEKYTILWILGSDSTSFAFGWVRNGYPFGDNAVLFWPFSTYIGVIISGCFKMLMGSVIANVPAPPITRGTHNTVEANCCKSW